MHARFRPLLRFLYSSYWRVQVKGAENVPASGAALIVANHSGAIPIDAAMLSAAAEFALPAPRLMRFLFDRFVSDMPLIGDFYRKVGSVPASYENGLSLLRQGDLVGIFPEGVAGVAKGFAHRYQLQEFRTGFVRMSLEAGVPIIPAAVGAERRIRDRQVEPGSAEAAAQRSTRAADLLFPGSACSAPSPVVALGDRFGNRSTLRRPQYLRIRPRTSAAGAGRSPADQGIVPAARRARLALRRPPPPRPRAAKRPPAARRRKVGGDRGA
jgi:hypothetical protein